MKIDYAVIESMLKNVTLYGDSRNVRLLYAEYQMPNGDWRFSNIDGEDFRAFLRISYADLADCDEPLNEQHIIQRLHDDTNF